MLKNIKIKLRNLNMYIKFLYKVKIYYIHIYKIKWFISAPHIVLDKWDKPAYLNVR